MTPEQEWDGDRPLPEDDAIKAAHPMLTGRHDLYAEAMRLVGAKHSKGALVGLVNWLLSERSSEVKGLKRQLTIQRDNNYRRNVELDALHYVWCDGGCKSGTHRYDDTKVTQEIVDAAIRNTSRLVTWWRNKGHKAEWAEMSGEQRTWVMSMFDTNRKLTEERNELARCLLVVAEENERVGLAPKSSVQLREIANRCAPGVRPLDVPKERA